MNCWMAHFVLWKFSKTDWEEPIFYSSCLVARLSVHPSASNYSALTGLIFVKFLIGDFHENMSRKLTGGGHLWVR
jgi:hypothetical protein